MGGRASKDQRGKGDAQGEKRVAGQADGGADASRLRPERGAGKQLDPTFGRWFGRPTEPPAVQSEGL